MKMYWPVPQSYSREIPEEGVSSFWKNRKDRYHCGVDIYAPPHSSVIAIENCEVIERGIFTSPQIFKHWKETYYVLVKNLTGLFVRYAELSEIWVEEGAKVKGGNEIGRIGKVIDEERLENAPDYIKNLVKEKRTSMLHIEVYSKKPEKSNLYIGGNWFSDKKPEGILNPVDYLRKCIY